MEVGDPPGPDLAPVSMDGDPPDRRVGGDPDTGSGARRWLAPVLVVVVVVAAGLTAWTFAAGDGRLDSSWSAPVDVVTRRWDVAAVDGGWQPVAVVGDDVVLQQPAPGASDGHVLQRRDGRTGDVVWSVRQDPTSLVVVVDGDRPVVPVFLPERPSARLVGIAAATGNPLWEQAATDESSAGRLRTGELWVTGDRGCGVVHPPTGRFVFTSEGSNSSCQPAGDGLAWDTGGEWVLVDPRGAVVGRAPVDPNQPRAPIVSRDRVLSLDGATLVSTDRDGTEAWRRDLGAGTWWWMATFGDDHLVVVGERDTVAVDVDDGTVTARTPGQPQPFVTGAGDLRLLLDRSGMSIGEAAGIWSRSPDAATFALLDADGDVLGTQDVVVTTWPVVTQDGVLLAHGPDDRRRLSLFDPDDLSQRWQVPLDLRQAEVVGSGSEVVVLQGFRGGALRLVAYTPEG